eukprot:10061683-Heterocapsa_arctica.AAC.1
MTEVQTNRSFFNGAQVRQRAMHKAKQVQAAKRAKHKTEHNIITEAETEDKQLDFVVEDRRKQYQGYLYQTENRVQEEKRIAKHNEDLNNTKYGATIVPKHNKHSHDQ